MPECKMRVGVKKKMMPNKLPENQLLLMPAVPKTILCNNG